MQRVRHRLPIQLNNTQILLWPDGFVDEAGEDMEDLGDMNRRAAHHARLDRREREFNDEDLARIAQDVTRRYRPTTQKYTGELNQIPQRLLMPSVQDAHLWQVRVRVGRLYIRLRNHCTQWFDL